MKYRDYTILKADCSDDLIPQVKEHIDRGWEPVGGVSVVQYRDFYAGKEVFCTQYAQAMVKPVSRLHAVMWR